MEYRGGKRFLKSWKPIKKGNKQPILVIPGLTASPWSTGLLRSFLNSEDFIAYDWGLGRNLGNLNDVESLEETLVKINEQHQSKVVIIGWSLGGIYARRLGQKREELTKSVITLGSPYRDIRSPNYASWFFNLLQKLRGNTSEPEWANTLHEPLSMPTIAFYSKKDGIVPWEACYDPDDETEHSNIEVHTSHFGMGASEEVLHTLLNQLYI